MKKLSYLLVFIFLFSGSLIAQTTWNIDKSHTNITFTVSHMVVAEVEGNFNDFEGSVVTESEDFQGAEVSIVIKVESIDTDNERRDNHLKSDDFFNAETYPEIKFSGKIVQESGKYYLDGDFTMRDVTKPIKFDVKFNGTIDTGRGVKAGFKITGSVNRFDYNLKWDRTLETGNLVVGEDVEIACNVELNKQADS